MQKVEKVELQSDIKPDQKTTYLKYIDEDGATHYVIARHAVAVCV